MQDQVAGEGKLFHEDIEVGRTYDCGRKQVTKEEIIAFARQFDPQPMHLDEEAAKRTLAGGLCASGFHTCAMMMRMVCDGILNRVASLGSPGVDEVRWLRPVRPGDVMATRYIAQEKRILASRPDVGMTKVLVEFANDKGELAASWLTNQLTRVRAPGPLPANPAPKREKQAIESLWDLALPPGSSPADAYFEDRRVGEIVELKSHTFAKDDIIAFARAYDPQPFHLDEAAAKASLFGGLCASGWHTAAVFIRGVVDARNVSQRGSARPRRAARHLRSLAGFPQSQVAEAGVRRRHGLVSHAPGREDRSQVAPRSRPARQRGAGPQPEGRDRIRRHLADPGRAPRALPAGIAATE